MHIQLHSKLIETYIQLLEEALIEKRVILDSGDYAGLIIHLKDEQAEAIRAVFKQHNAFEANWGSMIFLDKEKRTRMFLDNTKEHLSVYVNEFPTYGAVSTDYRENVDKFIKHLNPQGFRDNKLKELLK